MTAAAGGCVLSGTRRRDEKVYCVHAGPRARRVCGGVVLAALIAGVSVAVYKRKKAKANK